jgi:hypothetical protein
MSALIGPLTPGRIVFAFGTIGLGALVGGGIAQYSDKDIGRGALIGGASALAGLGLLFGGATAWNRLAGARSASSAAVHGVSQLGTIAHSMAPAAAPRLSSSFAAAIRAAVVPSIEAVPAIARTPMLPVAAGSGSTFLSTMARFLI